jgi:glucosylceramidase
MTARGKRRLPPVSVFGGRPFMRLSCAALSLILAVLPAQAQHKTVSVWMTTEDRSSLTAKQMSQLHFQKKDNKLPQIDVDDKQKFQSIDGFGFALTGGSAQLLMRMDAQQRAKVLKELFETEGNGIGVSYLRVSIGSSDLNDHVFTYDDMPPGGKDVELTRFSLDPDRADVIPVLRQILSINPKIKILGSPWSAPSWMKTNEDPKGGSLKPEYYSTYANYFVKYIEGMKAEGIAIDAITIQNEPLNEKNTPSMKMLALEQAAFIKGYLGPAFRKAGITTKVILYDHNCDVPEYPLTVLDDPEARPYVDGSGFHLYGGDISAMSKVHNAYPDKNLYFTEQMVIDRPGDTRLRVASPVQRIMIGAMRNWSRNVLLWNLAADPENKPHTNNGGCTMCEGAITLDGNKVTRNVAYYVVAHASKFVRPGSVRVQSSSPDTLPNVAFKTNDGKDVLIVANNTEGSQTFQIHYGNKNAVATLDSGAVATYVW